MPNAQKSGRRGSNPRPIAWKAIALPTELLPLIFSFKLGRQSLCLPIAIGMSIPAFANRSTADGCGCGGNRIRTYEVIRQQIYSLSQLAALVFPLQLFLRTNEKPPESFQEAFLKRECKIIRFYTFSKLITRF